MAERRMFTKKITESDAFLDMPASTQALYFHLSMNADDDGFINCPKRIQRTVGAGDDDMRLLLAKSFIISFDTGVIVIKHWKMHNYIQTDRYKPTDYQDEKAMLQIKDNKAYTLAENEPYTECIQDVYIGKDSIGKDRLGKDSIGKDSIGKDRLGKDSIGKTKSAKAPVRYYDDEELNKAFTDYVDMRKQIKAPMTDKAVELAKNKLQGLSRGDNNVAIEILNQSIMNSWKGLFELKNSTPKTQAVNWDEV